MADEPVKMVTIRVDIAGVLGSKTVQVPADEADKTVAGILKNGFRQKGGSGISPNKTVIYPPHALTKIECTE